MSWKPTKPIALTQIVDAKNLCDLLADEDLTIIGKNALDGYTADLSSRSGWESRTAQANLLAMQVMEEKRDPMTWGANVKFPLLTVGAMQFHARAFPALITEPDLVKIRVFGPDPKGEKTARAKRLAEHMSWQNLEQDASWISEHDKLILATAITGCSFVKSVYEPGPGRLLRMLVLPQDFVVNYYTRSLEDSPRYTHRYFLTANNIRQRELDQRFREIPTRTENALGAKAPIAPDTSGAQGPLQEARDRRQGVTEPAQDKATTPWLTGEQYCWLDLDGDGYEEPYIVTFDIASGEVRRIVARFLPSGVKFLDNRRLTDFAVRKAGESERTEYDVPRAAKVYKIAPVKVFTKFGFIPSPDGGFFDLGLGQLAGPINASVNTMLNQLIDAGTMANLGGGFLGRGWKGAGGPITFAPQQWHRMDNAGEDIRKSVLPLPVREPSATLFQLLAFLVQYAERIVSATEIQVGESPGQNMKADTARILNENGQRIYTAIYKRFWLSLREEYGVQYELNALFFSADQDFYDLTTGPEAMVRPNDYEGPKVYVRPAADPHVISDAEAERQALTLLQLANTQPNFNRYRTTVRLLKAQRVPNIDEVYPPPMTQGPDGKPAPAPDVQMPPNPKLLEAQRKMAETQLKEKQFQANAAEQKFYAMIDANESTARIAKLNAEVVKLTQEAKGAQVDPIIKMIYAMIESEGKRQDRVLKYAEMMTELMNGPRGASADRGEPGMAGMAGSPANAIVPGVARPNGQGQPAGVGQPGF